MRVDAKSGICYKLYIYIIYIYSYSICMAWMDGTRARVPFFFLKTRLFRLDPSLF